MYKVKTDQFEGPFPLLLELIEKNKLDVTQLSLAKVADDYLEYIEQNQAVSLSNLSEFLLVASQLILLKSKALLPLFEFTQEEEEEIGNLQERLQEYQRFKEAARKLTDIFFQKQVYFSKNEENISVLGFVAPKITAAELKEIYVKILDQIPQTEELAQEIVEEVVSLEDKINHLRHSLQSRISLAFHETIKDAKDKIEVIVTFLALLEMVKQKVLLVKQENLFGEIVMEKTQDQPALNQEQE